LAAAVTGDVDAVHMLHGQLCVVKDQVAAGMGLPAVSVTPLRVAV
jgi:hypothetical protein